MLGSGQPLEELPLLCVTLQPAALVLAVRGPVNTALAKKLCSLQMDIACPLALIGDGLPDSIAVLHDIPIALLDQRNVGASLKLDALLRGAFEL
ncbi:hypothetical protein D3C78_1349870 [compost metagenome]